MHFHLIFLVRQCNVISLNLHKKLCLKMKFFVNNKPRNLNPLSDCRFIQGEVKSGSGSKMLEGGWLYGRERAVTIVSLLYRINYRVSTRCLQGARDLRMNQPDELPSEVDFAKLCEGLEQTLKRRLEEHRKLKNRTTWRHLAEVVQVIFTYSTVLTISVISFWLLDLNPYLQRSGNCVDPGL